MTDNPCKDTAVVARTVAGALRALGQDTARLAEPPELWTRHVKECLIGLGKAYWPELFMYANGLSDDLPPFNGGRGEWLYDLCWLEYDGPTSDTCRWRWNANGATTRRSWTTFRSSSSPAPTCA